MEENIKMSLEDYPRFVNDNDPELAIAKAMFLSTRPNSHRFNISEDVLQKYASTILGKFLVGNLNIFETDVMSHERKPDIFGYIPNTQEVEFVRAEDGYLDAYVNIVVSKIYATEVYNLFLDDNFRNVSVEMRVMYANEESKDVVEFNIAGLTVLGKLVNPSIPHAHMEMIRFSADEAEKYYCEHIKCSEDIGTEVLRKLNAIYDKLSQNETINKENTEEKMAKLEEEKKDVVMEQPTEEAPKEEEEKKLAEDAENKEEEKKEEPKNEKASENSDSENKEDDKDEKEEVKEEKASEEEKKEDEDKLAKSEAHCAELEKKCANLEEKCANLEVKLSDLEKFKADTEEKEKMAIVTQTLAQVKESMDSDTYAKFEEKAKEQTLDTVNAWRNEVLANVATVLMSAKKDESHLRMGINEHNETPTSLWDRM